MNHIRQAIGYRKDLISLWSDRTVKRSRYGFAKHFGTPLASDLQEVCSSYVSAASLHLSMGQPKKAYFLLNKTITKYPSKQDSGFWPKRLVFTVETTSQKLNAKHLYEYSLSLLEKTIQSADPKLKPGLETMLNETKTEAATWYVEKAKKEADCGFITTASLTIKEALKYAPERKTELYPMVAEWYVQLAKTEAANDFLSTASQSIEAALKYAPERKTELYDFVAKAYLNRANLKANRMPISARIELKTALKFAASTGIRDEINNSLAILSGN